MTGDALMQVQLRLPTRTLFSGPARHVFAVALDGAFGLLPRHADHVASLQPSVLIVTDGEPTSHLERNGEVYFEYPPHPLTIAHAVRELDTAGRLGAQTTFFRLGDDPGLARFLQAMARRAGGKVVTPDPEDLGAAVVGEFLRSRSADQVWDVDWN